MATPKSAIRTAEIRLVTLLTTGQRGGVEQAIKSALKSGSGSRRLAEILLHCSLLVGIPSALDALDTLRKLSTKPLLGGRTRHRSRGLAAFRSIYGTQSQAVLKRLSRIDPFIGRWIIDCAYGAVYSRPSLRLNEREIFTAVVLALQDLPIQFVSHVRGALRLGVDTSELTRWLMYAGKLARVDTSEQCAVVSHFRSRQS